MTRKQQDYIRTQAYLKGKEDGLKEAESRRDSEMRDLRIKLQGYEQRAKGTQERVLNLAEAIIAGSQTPLKSYHRLNLDFQISF